jgi:hypothetical protein
MGEKRNVYGVLLRKPKGKRLLRRLRLRWEDSVKMTHREIGLGWYAPDKSESG